MEPLWSPVVGTGGNQWQIESPRKRQKQAETVAVGCHRLPIGAHGKEGVRGSSPREGFPSSLLIRFFRRLVRRRKHGAASTERPRPAAFASRAVSKSSD